MQYRAAGLGAFGQGLGDLAQSYMGRGALEAQARRDEERAWAERYLRQQQGRKAGFEADIAGDTFAHRQRLGDYTSQMLGAAGIADPRAAEALAGMYRGSGGSANDLAGLMAKSLEAVRRGEAVDAYRAGQPDLTNVLLRAGGAVPYEPFRATTHGAILDQGTGAVREDTGLARAALGAIAADEAQKRAAAGLSTERGRILAERAPYDLERIRAQAELARAQAGLAGSLAGGVGLGTVPLTKEKRAELQNQITDLDTGLAALDRALTAIPQGTGIGSAMQQGANWITGQAQSLGAPLEAPFPETAEARANLRVLERELIRTLAANPRFPVAEQEVIRRLIPTPDEWLGNPLDSMQRLRSLREFVVNKRSDAAGQLGVALPDETQDFSRVIGTLPLEQIMLLEPELLTELERAALARRLDQLEQGGR